jgi:F-type H+-transporting ATPase subunit b
MQQLFAAFGIDWHLLIAQAINFGLVMLALWYFLYRPVLSVLEKRREMVAQGVRDAEEAKEKLEHADGEAAKRVSKADDEAEHILKSAREAANAEKAQIVGSAEARAAQVAKDAEARAAEEAERMRRQSEKEVARLAILAAEKVLSTHHEAR